jgi:cytochrome c oxidase cbb3-type subunit 3
MRALCSIFLALGAVILLASCKTEDRNFSVQPQAADTDKPVLVTMSDLHPGGSPIHELPKVNNEYEENAYALSEGKRLFDTFNCSGCHAHGGGGIGPALMDDKWIYGSKPEQIHATIVEGRPNGMPTFRGRIPDYQVWQLTAYVRSLGGLTSSIPAPGRDDHMKGKPPENTQPRQQPHDSAVPPPTGHGL